MQQLLRFYQLFNKDLHKKLQFQHILSDLKNILGLSLIWIQYDDDDHFSMESTVTNSKNFFAMCTSISNSSVGSPKSLNSKSGLASCGSSCKGLKSFHFVFPSSWSINVWNRKHKKCKFIFFLIKIVESKFCVSISFNQPH